LNFDLQKSGTKSSSFLGFCAYFVFAIVTHIFQSTILRRKITSLLATNSPAHLRDMKSVSQSVTAFAVLFASCDRENAVAFVDIAICCIDLAIVAIDSYQDIQGVCMF
jgi:hypothetical protein